MGLHKDPERYDEMIRILKAGSTTVSDISKQTGMNERRVRYYLTELNKDKKIQKTLTLKDGRKIKYKLIGNKAVS